MEDSCAPLGVARAATTGEIKAAYRRIAMETRPDLNGGSAVSVA